MKRKWAAAAIACAAAVSMSVTAYAAEPSENTEMVSVQEETGEIPEDSTAQAGTEGETEETGTEDQTEKTEGSADTETPGEDEELAQETPEEDEELEQETPEEDDVLAQETPVEGEVPDQETPEEADAEDTEVQAEGALSQQIIDGKKYMVYPDGTHYTGWLQLSDTWRLYFDPNQDGAAAVGLSEAEGRMYLFDANGILHTGAGTPVIDGEKYWMNQDGSLNSGWLNLGKWRLYFDEETYEARTGLSWVGEKRYLFDANGSLYAESGTPVIDGHKYWFTDDGSLATGWLHLGSWTMYFDEETCQGAKGVTVIDGKTYVFEENGVLLTGTGTPVINGKKYCFNADGSIQTGWVTIGSWTFYFDPQTGAAATGVAEIDGNRCFFDKNGVLMTDSLTETQERACRVLDEVGWNLRAAFNWSAGLTYRTPQGAPSGVERVQWYADYGYTTGTGNCYVMAATFYEMAKLLGYDVYYVEGSVPLAAGGFGPHGWCEIVLNGATYVFDPNFTNETGRNGYQITYGTSGTWRYMNFHRVV